MQTAKEGQFELDRMLDPIDKMLDRLTVDTVFGEPAREGDLTIIPVAEVGAAFGYGYGYGQGEAEEADEEGEAAMASGGGAGGGGMGKAKPCGYIRVTPEGVSYEPAMNPGLISLAGMALGAWAIFWFAAVLKAFARR